MEELDIKDFLSYLKKFLWVLIALPILAVAGVYYYETQVKTPLYESSAQVALLQSESTNASTVLNEINANQKLTSTYSVIAKSKTVLEQVISELELSITPEELAKNVKVSNIPDTTILKISVTSKDPLASADIANSVANVFMSKTDLLSTLDNVALLETAEPAKKPSNDTLIRDLIIVALASIFAVVGVAFIIYYFDDTIKYSGHLENEIKLPIAGKIVKSDIKMKKGVGAELIVKNNPKSLVSESIRSLRTNLQFASIDKKIKTIHITSSIASEGKSFVSANLATAFAQAGRTVLLVDCDLRKGRQHKVFFKANTIGLTNLLADDLKNRGRYIQETDVKNLFLLTRGTSVQNPAELLNSEKNKNLIKRLKKDFDLVIFDSAPCGAVADPAIMSTLADITLIVARNAKTPRPALLATKDSLEKVGAKIAGVVINDIDRKVGHYYNYYGGYYEDRHSHIEE